MNGDGYPFARTVPLALTISMLGEHRKVSTSKVEVDADKALLAVNKKLFDCDEYNAIKKHAGAIRSYLQGKEVPGGDKLFRAGTYPIPVQLLSEVDGKLESLIEEFRKLVKAFCAVYDQRRDEAMARLRDLANAKDYPSADQVYARFGVTYQYVSLGPPAALEGLSGEIWKRERDKIAASCREAADEVRLALRQLFQDLLLNMTERLTPGDGGKKKIFRDSLVGNIREFMDDFDAKNITGDAELEDLVNKCRKILAGKSPDMLRQDGFLRDETTKALAIVKDKLDGMVAEMPSRKITLED
jgi:hypothetical protein